MNNLKTRRTFLLGLAFLLVCLLAGTLFSGCSDGAVTEKPPSPTPTPSATSTVTVTGSTTGDESTAGSVGTPDTEATPGTEATPEGDNEVTFPSEWGEMLDEPTTSAESTVTPAKTTPSPSLTKAASATTEIASTTAGTVATATPEPTTEATPVSPDPDGEGWIPGWY